MNLVPVAGLVILGAGLFGVLWPRAAIGRLERWWRSTRGMQFAIVLRVGLGLLLILQASATRYPRSIGVLGLLCLVAAIGAGLVGYRCIRVWIEWWVDRPSLYIRLMCVLPCVLGGFLIHAAPWTA